MPKRSNAIRRGRGAAMLLVLIAVAVCTIMALSFLAAQEPAAVVASNIDRKVKARAIAESALKMAIDYVNEDADWRTDQSSGEWITDAALDGGVFTLSGLDEADGDLSNDPNQPVTLTVVATFDGVTHRVSALVTPGQAESSTNRLLLVVSRDTSPSARDAARKTLFESWGYTVTLIDDGASTATYNALVAENDVVYISEECVSGSINTKLRDVTIGVVSDESYLHDDFGFTANNISSGSNSRSIDIADNSHPITAGFPLGPLEVFAYSNATRYTGESLPAGATVLADRHGGSTDAVLMVADAGDQLRYGTSAGRRVMFLSSDDIDVERMTDDGLTILRRSIEWAAGASDAPSEGEIPTLLALYEFDQVEVAPTLAGRWPLDETGSLAGGSVRMNDRLILNNGSYIDAYDASAGAYGGANRYLPVDFLTNSTGDNDIQINDGTIYGDVQVGSGGDTSRVIQVNSGGITGSASAQASNADIDDFDTPSGFGSHSGNQTYNGGNHTWSADQHFNQLTLNNGARVRVTGDVQIRVSNQMNLNDGDIELNPGATLTLWLGHNLTINNGSTINNDTTRPGDLTINQYGNNRDLNLNDGVIVGTIHVADDVTINNGSRIYGSLTAYDNITINDGSIHADIGTAPAGSTGASPTTAADTSSSNNDGTVHGDPRGGVAGQLGTAFEFDGDDDYIEILHDDRYLMQGGTFSVWFKPDSTSGRQGLFSKDSSGYDTGGHFSVFLDGSRVEVRMQSTTQSHYVYSPSNSIAAGNWYHVMFAWGEEGMALYLDGVLVDSNGYTGGLGTTSGGIGNYEPIVLGSNAWRTDDLSSNGLEDFFDGTLDDLRIYNERLSESQAVEIFNGAIEPSPFQSESIIEDTSGYGDPLTLSVTETDDVSWSTNALTFTGNTQATSLLPATKLHDAIEATGEFAVELLITPAASGSTASPSRIVSYTDGPSSHNFMLGQDARAIEARVRETNTGNNGTLSPEFLAGSSMTGSADRHVVLSYQEGSVSVYIDGQLAHTQSPDGVLNNWDIDHYLVFGGAFGGGSHWQGTLKRVAVYDRSFDAVQADNVFNGDDPGPGGASASTGAGSVRWDEPD